MSSSGVDAEFLGARNTYARATLDVSDIDPDPIVQLQRWIDDATSAGVVEPTAMAIATLRSDGSLASRNVLLRAVGAHGLEFFTNTSSAKADELSGHPQMAALFSWLDLQRQVRVEGTVEALSPERSDEYFAGRPRGSQIGAWASPQSAVIADRDELERLVIDVEERFDGASIPRPPFWGGYGLAPARVEFWQGRPSRLHDRLAYRWVDSIDGGAWVIERLAP